MTARKKKAPAAEAPFDPTKPCPDCGTVHANQEGRLIRTMQVSSREMDARAEKIIRRLKVKPVIQPDPVTASALALVGVMGMLRAGGLAASLLLHFQWIIHHALLLHIEVMNKDVTEYHDKGEDNLTPEEAARMTALMLEMACRMKEVEELKGNPIGARDIIDQIVEKLRESGVATEIDLKDLFGGDPIDRALDHMSRPISKKKPTLH